MQSHIRKVYACLTVTCHLRFWRNDRGLLRATAVTRGWNGYRNKSQLRKSTLDNKILPPLQQGFEPATFRSRVRRSNHWAIPAPGIIGSARIIWTPPASDVSITYQCSSRVITREHHWPPCPLYPLLLFGKRLNCYIASCSSSLISARIQPFYIKLRPNRNSAINSTDNNSNSDNYKSDNSPPTITVSYTNNTTISLFFK